MTTAFLAEIQRKRRRHFGVKLKAHSEEVRYLLPPVIGRLTIEIRTTRLFRHLLYFQHGNRFARFLRHLRRRRWDWTRDKSIDFVGVEPDEVTYPANVDSHRGFVRQFHFNH